jgi:hypothetical protein
MDKKTNVIQMQICFYAYYRKRWVDVPLRYIPPDAVDEEGEVHYYKFIPLDDTKLTPSSTPERRNDTKAFLNICMQIKECLIPWMMSDNEIKRLCRKNSHIPYLWVTGKVLKPRAPRKFNEVLASARKRKILTNLSKQDFRRFYQCLKKISPKSALIAQILWYHNNLLYPDYVTLEEVLRVQIKDISHEEALSRQVALHRPCHETCILIPEALWNGLCRLISEKSCFVFTNKSGAPMEAVQVINHFKAAGKMAGIKGVVTSLSLRPSNLDYKAQARKKMYFDDVSIENWEVMLKRIPDLKPSRGCKSKHAPRWLLNGILYHFRTGCPWRKIPTPYPPGQAVHSQYRRWVTRGVFDTIISSLKELTPKYSSVEFDYNV